ncbi:protein RESTRICTED TEV MOVEMENT 2-like [Juglans microcarpa x Juglans regia]|uniref:protein RESTRICTED TEV MOVEMENT 2-like n=1 Tax=Juglans microcarpa x Juglans regia TaxID=2249226 RepID=UPI001B7EAB9A|nr:protein RESTRICTED TEV MOVEMENT 2-like [Juglans microcarpa x Juglans regia]
MAMRRQSGVTTATPPQAVRPVYEDFQPKYEQKQEATEHIIQVHLPGFVKERIKIRYVNSSRTLRIQGERPRQDNRWSRFNQTFSVPENCDVDKIQGRFLSGILTITMPKIARVGPAAEDKTAKAAPSLPKSTPQPKLPEVPEQIPPTPAASTSGVEKPMEEKIARTPSLKRAATEPKVEKGLEDIPPEAATTAINERQRVVESSQSQSPPGATATTEPKAQMGQDLAPQKAALTTDTLKLMDKTSMESSAKQVDQKSIPKKDVLIEGNAKAGETKEPEKIVESRMVKGRESGEKSRDSVMPETTAPKIAQTGKEKKERPSGVKKEKPKEDFSSEIGMGLKNMMGSAKHRVNDLAKRMNEDDRKMLVNIGAAVVVLVALGAYVSYSYGSSGKSEK